MKTKDKSVRREKEKLHTVENLIGVDVSIEFSRCFTRGFRYAFIILLLLWLWLCSTRIEKLLRCDRKSILCVSRLSNQKTSQNKRFYTQHFQTYHKGFFLILNNIFQYVEDLKT